MLKIHTFELQKLIKAGDERCKILRSLRGLQFESNHTESYTSIRIYGGAKYGIIIKVFWDKFARYNKVCLQVNPCVVMGMQEKRLFEVDETGFLQCLQKIYDFLRGYRIDLWDFRISRVDFTRDIRFERTDMADVVIELLRKTGALRGYSVKKYGEIVYPDSYNVENYERGEIVVYNKEKEYIDRNEKEREQMKGVMRLEARTNVLNLEEEILLQNKLCFSRLLQAQARAEMMIKGAFTEGIYMKASSTKKILYRELEKRGVSKRQKNKLEKMIEFVDGVAVHQNLGKCLKGKTALFGYETTKDIVQQLADRRINLVSISARKSVAVIPDMLYMLKMKTEAEMQKDTQFLTENNLLNQIPVYELL